LSSCSAPYYKNWNRFNDQLPWTDEPCRCSYDEGLIVSGIRIMLSSPGNACKSSPGNACKSTLGIMLHVLRFGLTWTPVKDWSLHPLWTFPCFHLCFFMIISVSNMNCYWETRLSLAAWKSKFLDWAHPRTCEIVFQLYLKVYYVKDHNFWKWPFCACYVK
jgi:hypothetical protein